MNSTFFVICAWKRFCAGERTFRGRVDCALSPKVFEGLEGRAAAGVGVESLFMLAGAHRWKVKSCCKIISHMVRVERGQIMGATMICHDGNIGPLSSLARLVLIETQKHRNRTQ
ncbi:hypothetical protein M7I_0583 [Glarea lozoyensis 74030]|uniref:Uncharacterized protein n=1 Tax=Glarea lozoyensis (strain ATCC 74030 / MF5533) TaxID=1104152 RepID=H0EDX3_GLAL7|nr:hypothetical protein M7I_0583 [Glarea lozoyensis 74030]